MPGIHELEVIIKRLEQPDKTRTFPKGRFDLIRIGTMTIGRASYETGWKWSTDVGADLGQKSCEVEHIGMVVSGRARAMNDGRVIELHQLTRRTPVDRHDPDPALSPWRFCPRQQYRLAHDPERTPEAPARDGLGARHHP